MTSRSAAYYASHPEAAAKKVATQARINRRPSERRRRALLNKERRRRGIDGKGGGDISHTENGGTVLEDPATNRARNGHGKQARLKADSLRGRLTPRRLLPRARRTGTTRPATKGRACGKSFIPGTARCKKPIQRQARAAQVASPRERLTPELPPITPRTRLPEPAATEMGILSARNNDHANHYLQYRNNPSVSNKRILGYFTELRTLDNVSDDDLRRVGSIIRRSKVKLDYSVFDRVMYPGRPEYTKAIATRYLGVHYERSDFPRNIPGDLGEASSIIYVRPTGPTFDFNAGSLQHVTTKGWSDIVVAQSLNDSSRRPDFVAGNMTLQNRTSAQESAVLMHELGHVVHARVGYWSPQRVRILRHTMPYVQHKDRAIDKRSDGTALLDTTSPLFVNAAQRTLGRYGLSDLYKTRAEMFAEAFVLYVSQSRRLRQESPYIYSWVHEIVRRSAAAP